MTVKTSSSTAIISRNVAVEASDWPWGIVIIGF
jgi:hypothetical protein